MIPDPLLEKQLSEEKAARLRAERERDEARDAARLAVSIGYLRACVGCDKPTWWRERATGAPRCLTCTPPEGADSVNVCPQKLRGYLPPYAAALSFPAVTAEGKKLCEEGDGA